MPPLLHRSYKHMYPFRLGTTSFIVRDDYVPNTRQLSPFLDEIELLVFESDVSSIPSPDTVRQLAGIAQESGIQYNVHLPVDVNLADPSPAKRLLARDCLLRVMDRLCPLSPTTWTLHLDGATYPDTDQIHQWQVQAGLGLQLLMDAGIDVMTISLENLFYPVPYWQPLLEEYPVSLCLDIGHAILTRQPPAEIFRHWSERISIIHLHGVSEGRDHLPLSRLPAEDAFPVLQLLRTFTGSVSLEVFSLPSLSDSLIWLEQAYFRHDGNISPDPPDC